MAASVNKWLAIFGIIIVAGLSSFQVKESAPPATHPLYMSVVEINHNQSDKTLEISCKIFANDFENTLEKNFKTRPDLTKPKDKTVVDRMINEYISHRLSLKVDGKPVHYSFLGFEKEDDAIYSYFQVDNIPSVKKIEIANSLLHDFSESQINIIHCTVEGKRQSIKLDYPKNECSFSF